MAEKLKIAGWLSFVGGILLLLSGIFSIFSGGLLLVFIFGSDFMFLFFMLFTSIAIIGISIILTINLKYTRILGLVNLILGAILFFLNLRSVSFLNAPAMFGGSITAINGVIAVSGGVLSMIGGVFALSWNPQSKPSVLDK